LCGGRIAYDIASQLHAQGEEVGLVALIQTLRDVTGFKKMSVGEKLGAHWNNLLHSGPDYGIRKAKGGVRKAKKEFQILQWKLRKLLGLTLPQAYYDFTYQKAMSKGNAEFVEMREQNYPGRAVLFRARESVAFYDSKFGWGDQMNDKWEIYDIPGSESNLLQEPPVKLLAEKLTVDIDAALAKK
ncbi:MAG: hypothetical protein JO235_26265, partial [Chroococcidiopsidaceae cyanobacterium CP_BM_RX_35]|nr:hypothetical protein [Chroococcidiopsidaceae cyanobacterium CP_BM_RX_35]